MAIIGLLTIYAPQLLPYLVEGQISTKTFFISFISATTLKNAPGALSICKRLQSW
jgi:hypothetical protein